MKVMGAHFFQGLLALTDLCLSRFDVKQKALEVFVHVVLSDSQCLKYVIQFLLEVRLWPTLCLSTLT